MIIRIEKFCHNSVFGPARQHDGSMLFTGQEREKGEEEGRKGHDGVS